MKVDADKLLKLCEAVSVAVHEESRSRRALVDARGSYKKASDALDVARDDLRVFVQEILSGDAERDEPVPVPAVSVKPSAFEMLNEEGKAAVTLAAETLKP